MLRPRIARVFEQLDQEEGSARVGLPEAQVLIEAAGQLVVEVDMYEFARVEGLRHLTP